MAEAVKDENKVRIIYNEIIERPNVTETGSKWLDDISLPLLIDFLHDETDLTIPWNDIKFKNPLPGESWANEKEKSILKKVLDYKPDGTNAKYSDGIYAFYFKGDDNPPDPSPESKVPLKFYLDREIYYCGSRDTTVKPTTLAKLLYGYDKADEPAPNNYTFAYENVDAWSFPKEVYAEAGSDGRQQMLRTQPAARLDSAGQGAYRVKDNDLYVTHFIHDLLHTDWKVDDGALQKRRIEANDPANTGANNIFSVDVKNLKKRTIDTIKKYCIESQPTEGENNLLHVSLDIINNTLESFSYNPMTNVVSFIPHGPGNQNKQVDFHISYNGVLKQLKKLNQEKYGSYKARNESGGKKGGADKKVLASTKEIIDLVSNNTIYKLKNQNEQKIIKDFILKILKYMGDESHSMNVDYIKEKTKGYKGGDITPIVFVKDQLLMTRLIIREQCFIAQSIASFHHLPQYNNIKSDVEKLPDDIKILNSKTTPFEKNKYLKKRIFILHNVSPPTLEAIKEIISSVKSWENNNCSDSEKRMQDVDETLISTLKDRKNWYDEFLQDEYYQHIDNLIKYEKLIEFVVKKYTVGGGGDGVDNIKEKVNKIWVCFNGTGTQCPPQDPSGLNIFTILTAFPERSNLNGVDNDNKIYIDFTDQIKNNMEALYDVKMTNNKGDKQKVLTAEPSQDGFNKSLEKTNEILMDFVKLHDYLDKYKTELEAMRKYAADAAAASDAAPAADAAAASDAAPAAAAAAASPTNRTLSESLGLSVGKTNQRLKKLTESSTILNFEFKLNKLIEFLELFKITNLEAYTNKERDYMHITEPFTRNADFSWIKKIHYDQLGNLFLNARTTRPNHASRPAKVGSALRYPFLFYRAPQEDTTDTDLINGRGKLQLKSNQNDEGLVLDFYYLLNNLNCILNDFKNIPPTTVGGGRKDEDRGDTQSEPSQTQSQTQSEPSQTQSDSDDSDDSDHDMAGSPAPPAEEEEEEEEEEAIGAFWNKVKKQSRIYSTGSNFYRLYVNYSEYIESYESIVAAGKEVEDDGAATDHQTDDKVVDKMEIEPNFFDLYIKNIISDEPEKITYMEKPLLPNNPFLIPFWYAFIDDCIHNVLGEEGNNREEEIIVSSEKTEAEGETKPGTTMILYSSRDADHFEWNILKEIFHKRNEHFIKFFNKLDGRSEEETGENEYISVDWITDGNKQEYNCPEYHKNYRIDNGKYAGVVLKDIIRDIKLYYDNHRSTVFKFEINDDEKLKYNEMVDKAKIAFFEMAKKGKEEEEEEEVVLAADVLVGLREPNKEDGAVRPVEAVRPAEEMLAPEGAHAPKKPRMGEGTPRGAARAAAAGAAAARAAAAGRAVARAAVGAMQRGRPPSRSRSRTRSPVKADRDRYYYASNRRGGKKTRKHRKIKIPKFSKDKNKKNKKNRKQTKNKKHKKGKTFKKKHTKTKRKD